MKVRRFKMASRSQHILKGALFYAAVIILTTAFLFAVIEGARLHLAGDRQTGIYLYFIGMLSLGTAVWVYRGARTFLVSAGYFTP